MAGGLVLVLFVLLFVLVLVLLFVLGLGLLLTVVCVTSWRTLTCGWSDWRTWTFG